jgi:hypothetical protein
VVVQHVNNHLNLVVASQVRSPPPICVSSKKDWLQATPWTCKYMWEKQWACAICPHPSVMKHKKEAWTHKRRCGQGRMFTRLVSRHVGRGGLFCVRAHMFIFQGHHWDAMVLVKLLPSSVLAPNDQRACLSGSPTAKTGGVLICPTAFVALRVVQTRQGCPPWRTPLYGSHIL